MATTYTTAQKVAEFLQRDNFSSTTTPTDTVVEDLINRNEDHIDQETNHAWREVTITDEYIDTYVPVVGLGWQFYLRHRSIRNVNAVSGDKIEIFDGNNFIDYVADKTQGRNEDYFVDQTNGTVAIRDRTFFYPKGNKFTYRYGESTVDKDIEDACTMLTAIDILTMNDKAGRFADDGPSNRLSHQNRIDAWKEKVTDILENKKEITIV